MTGKTYQPRIGGRYIRDPKTGKRVREKETAPKAPQGRPAAAPDGAPASEGNPKGEQPVRRKT
ncbi:hypothetical protein [uncultured Roseibium sp.]|uniref:hypothetical protein n=1 Tax=uncultured Roseibium sp. TaxID=1936171 RepID=UPI002595A598|nr:hypothetical protein [uncultured Roseibium sp.]